MSLFSNTLLEQGRIGEERCKALLTALGAQVQDVSADPHWQRQDVDLIATWASPAMTYQIEVKSDRHISRTHNVLFELLRLYHATGDQRMGWSHFSAAHYFFIWDTVDRVYAIRASHLRRAKDAMVIDTRPGVPLRAVESDAQATTINLLVPLSMVERYTVYRCMDGTWQEETRK